MGEEVNGACACVQEAELQRLAKAREHELGYKQQMDGLEVEKQKRLAQIESERFGQLVQSLGSDTLKEMARAGPDTQVSCCLCCTDVGFGILAFTFGLLIFL